MTTQADILDDFTTARLARLEAAGLIRRFSSEAGLWRKASDTVIASVENRLIERVLVARLKHGLRATRSSEQAAAVLGNVRAAYDEGRMETLPSFLPTPVRLAGRPPMPGDRRAPAVPTEPRRRPRIHYTPGGGFLLPPSRRQKVMIQALSDATGCEVMIGTHRLAPEHPFPAAVDDIAQGYLDMIAGGIEPGDIFLAADTAGASITLGALLRLQSRDAPLPAGIILFSPWCDLSLSGWSYISGSVSARSPFRMETAAFCARLYLQGALPTDPMASPIYARPAGWPPMLIHTSKHDLHFDDAMRLAENGQATGSDVRINYWDSPRHHLERLSNEDSRRSFSEVRTFIGDVWGQD